MFMIDMHGTLAFAIASRSSRTPGERYCGSCIASATRSYSFGLMAAGTSAESLPGSLRESTSTSPSRPLTGRRTRVPSLLMSSASWGRQTSFTLWPAMRSLVASSDPYEAPRMSMFRAFCIVKSRIARRKGASLLRSAEHFMLRRHIRFIYWADADLRPRRAADQPERAHDARIPRNPQRRGARVHRPPASRVRAAPPGAARAARRAAEGVRCRQAAGFPARNEKNKRAGLDGREPAEGPARSPRGDHRPDRPQ